MAQDYDGVEIDTLVNSRDLQLQREVLEPHPDLLQLHPDAATALSEADAALRRAHAQAVIALDLLNAEGDDQSDDLMRWDSLFLHPDDETRLRDQLDRWRMALDGPTVVEPGGTQRVDLRPLFQGRVVLRSVVPTFVPVLRGGRVVDIADAATVVPSDVTMDGLFPDFTREDWLLAWEKYGMDWGPVDGPPDGLTATVTGSCWVDVQVVDGSGDDLLLHVTDDTGIYSVRLFGVDASGDWAEMTVPGLSRSARVDLAVGGLVQADECVLEVQSGSVSLDAVEALH